MVKPGKWINNMNTLKSILISIILFWGFSILVAQSDLENDWMLVNYPWAYSTNTKSWLYFSAYDNQLWYYNSTYEFWRKKAESSTRYFPGESEFSSYEALESWAESFFFGAIIEQIEYNGKYIAIVARSHTSGLPTNDVSVFVMSDKDGTWRRSIFKDVIGDHFEWSVEDNMLVFTTKWATETQVVFSVNLNFITK